MVGLRRYILYDETVPVGTGKDSVTILLDQFLGEFLGRPVHRRRKPFVGEKHRVHGIHLAREAGRSLEGKITVIRDFCLAYSAFFGGNKDYSVSTSDTIDCSRCILQYRDIVDIVGRKPLEVGNTARNAVNNYKWSSQTAYIQVCVILTRLGCLLPNTHTGNTTG